MIEIGSLVRHKRFGAIGIVPSERAYRVAWADDLKSLHYAEEFEVIA
jgi:hypothetical protein